MGGKVVFLFVENFFGSAPHIDNGVVKFRQQVPYVSIHGPAKVSADLVPFFKVHIIVFERVYSFLGDKPVLEDAESTFRLQSLRLPSSVGISHGLHIFIVLWVNVPQVFPSCHIFVVPLCVVSNCLGPQGLVHVGVDFLNLVYEFCMDACNGS